MADTHSAMDRLVAPLPLVAYVEQPEVIDRLMVRLAPTGELYVRGTRVRIEEFVRECAAVGVYIRLRYMALCG